MSENPDIIKGICFYCKKERSLKYKQMQNENWYYVCPVCNASNSKYRLKNIVFDNHQKE